jgi:hypothetical protein
MSLEDCDHYGFGPIDSEEVGTRNSTGRVDEPQVVATE